MLCRNDVVLNKHTGIRSRLLSIDAAAGVAWTFNLEVRKALPEQDSLAKLHELEKAGTLSPVESTMPLAEIRASAKAKARANQAWERIEPLVANPDIWIPSERSRMVRERAAEVGCTMNTIYAHLRAYWAGGQTRLALLGQFHLAGRRGNGETANRGAKPSTRDGGVFQLKDVDLKCLVESLRKHYLNNDRAKLPAARQRIREEHYSFRDGNGVRILLPEGECPSLRQVRRVLKAKFSLELVLRKREGDTKFERDHRAKLSTAVAACVGVGHVYEVDATVMDVFVVAAKDRSRIIGKPTLYLIYDRKCRLIVGFYIGLENASWPAAMMAILSIAEDKAALCARYGIKYDPADWPAHRKFPREFVGDRGEMLSKNSSKIVSGLEIVVTNCPRERADFKGTVECGFKLIQQSMGDSLLGYEPSNNFKKRRGKHYEKDASLTLDELISSTLAAIIAHNRKPMLGYPQSLDSVCRQVERTPLALWADDEARRSGILTRFDADFVRFALLPQDNATVTDNVIRFRGCYYSCPEAVRDGWFVRAGRGVFSLPVSFDLRLVDAIYIHDPNDRTKWITATLLMAKSGDYQGMSFSEVHYYERLLAKVKAGIPDEAAQVQSDYHAHVDPISIHAKAEMRRVTKGKSRSARKADTKADRSVEKRERRQTEARMPATTPSAPTDSAEVIRFPSPEAPPSVTAGPTLGTPLTLAQRLAQKGKEMAP